MGKIRTYPPVKYFAAVTITPGFSTAPVYEELEKRLSSIDHHSGNYDFSDFTDYYEPEMGPELSKRMVSFEELQPAEHLPEIKIATNKIESKYSESDKRQINLDPGYISAAKMVLATTKDYDHRIYVGSGIFGDVHLRFRGGEFQINDWTYPDYRQKMIVQFFHEMRQTYLSQLKDWSR